MSSTTAEEIASSSHLLAQDEELEPFPDLDQDIELGHYDEDESNLSQFTTSEDGPTLAGFFNASDRRSSYRRRIPIPRVRIPGRRRYWSTRVPIRLPYSRIQKLFSGRSARSWSLLANILILLGFIQCVTFTYNFFSAVFPDQLDWVTGTSSRIGVVGGDIQPLACHSHNDYWRQKPLFTALQAGCSSVEADVWVFDDDLYVGHSVASLRPNVTLQNLYLNPLLDILEQRNTGNPFFDSSTSPKDGIFGAEQFQTLVLLVDFKNNGEAIWSVLDSQLDIFRERKYLTYFNGSSVVEGPITIVASGDAPFQRVLENPNHRDIFYDAPLDAMRVANEPTTSSLLASLPLSAISTFFSPSTLTGRDADNTPQQNSSMYNAENSYYASTSFRHSIGYLWGSRLSLRQLKLMRGQIKGAHERGIRVRYWGIPAWPVWMRNSIWRVMIREGVDYISVDDIRAATKDNWGPRRGILGRKWWQ